MACPYDRLFFAGEKVYPMRLLALNIAMVLITNVAVAGNSTVFEQGMKAFQAQDYPQAIQYFIRAIDQGDNPYVVNYNLGVSHYKLGQYQEAELAFSKALPSPKLKQIVEYNLGLVKLKQHLKREALEWFTKASRGIDDPKVAALANRMLAKYKVSKKRKNFIDGGIIAAYGYDSNVTQAATGTPSERSDHVLETYAYLNFLFRHVDLKFYYFNQDFSQLDSNDFTQLSAGLAFPFRAHKWRLTPSVHHARSELENMDYQTINDLRFDAKRFIGKGDYVRFRYRFSDIISDNPLYDYLDGSRHQLRADYFIITAYGRFRFRYEYEDNSRQNSVSDNYSPRRNSLQIQLKNSLSTHFRMKNELLYRNSHYEETAGFIREDYRRQYRFHLYAIPVRNFETGLRYTYTDNDSNDSLETFTRNVTQAYLNWYF